MLELYDRAKDLYTPLQRVKNISTADFEQNFAIPEVPMVLEGMGDHWPARKKWNLANFSNNYGDIMVNVSQSKNDVEKKMSLSDYISYVYQNQDEYPYYLKDWLFKRNVPRMEQDYEVLPHFQNWFALINNFIELCWIYIGPKKSFSKLHLDIYLTSAWNILFEGTKLWLFFPPDSKKSISEFKFDARFSDYEFPDEPGLEGYYTLQEPGDIVFTPGRWYHQVYNLDHTLALTENFINHTNYHLVREEVVKAKDLTMFRVLKTIEKKAQRQNTINA